MKSSFASAAALIVAAANAMPMAGSSWGPQGTSELATFDDLTATPLLSELSPVGTYKGLNWAALDVLQAGVAGIEEGVQPQSGANVAVNGVTDTLLNGALSITAKTVKSFDLESAYFGCAINTLETVASVPQQCTVAFTAYKFGVASPFHTVNQSFSPSDLLNSEMTQAIFDYNYEGVDRVDVAVVGGVTPGTLVGLLIDNVQYTTYAQ
ncbi:hypothetical protein LTR08_002480 [Meristemomyces frigidus]|nr:hypothetical protein LTR08_002480 [Meristemomyces frigidus]